MSLMLDIFEIQNKVINLHIEKQRTIYSFISRCHDCLSENNKTEEWIKIQELRREIFNLYFGDTFSTLINATRLALQGCETDSFALLRVVTQGLTEFEAIIDLSLYEQVHAELKENAPKGKSFSGKLQKKIRQQQNKGSEYIYGQLSNYGSHPSPARIRLSAHEDSSGEMIMKIGMILNNPNLEMSLVQISYHYMFAIQVFNKFFEKNLPENVDSPMGKEKKLLESEYQKLFKKIK